MSVQPAPANDRDGMLKMSELAERSGVSLLGVPVKLSRTPGAPAGPGPGLGEHTREVLSALGYEEGEIAALEEAGAVAGPAEAGARGSFMG